MGEILLVLVVLLLLFGAKRLPSIARSLGRSIEELRRTARNVTRDIMNSGDEHDVSGRSSGDPPPPASGERPG